jgi:ribosomal protein S18 acetylase RimI-like enzyme
MSFTVGSEWPLHAATMVTIREADAAGDLTAVHRLFKEYAESLGIDLGFQNFEDELATLPGAYAPICEMKRLYVRREARGQDVGRSLAHAAIAFGRVAGYTVMRLDTLPTMVAAQALYRQLGFRDVPPYRHNPIPGACFMELALGRLR